jgi:hypothetical protein
MRIEKITVTAGRTLPHPNEAYANVRSDVTLNATLDEGEDPVAALKQLQRQAEQLVEEHSTVLIASLEQRKIREQDIADIRRLESSIEKGNQQLAELQQRVAHNEVSQGLLFDDRAAAQCTPHAPREDPDAIQTCEAPPQ